MGQGRSCLVAFTPVSPERRRQDGGQETENREAGVELGDGYAHAASSGLRLPGRVTLQS